MRYYVRTGRRSGVSMPLWIGVLGYIVAVSVVWAVALAVGLALLVVLALFVATFLIAASVGAVRRRRALRK